MSKETATVATNSNYTPEMVERIVEVGPAINAETAARLAEEFGLTPASVRGKVNSMTRNGDDRVHYVAKAKTRKDGSPVEKKAEIVEDIAESLGSDSETLASLELATRNVLVMLRDRLSE